MSREPSVEPSSTTMISHARFTARTCLRISAIVAFSL